MSETVSETVKQAEATPKTEQPYREERAAIREWDTAVTERAAQRRSEMERLWQGRVKPAAGRGIGR